MKDVASCDEDEEQAKTKHGEQLIAARQVAVLTEWCSHTNWPLFILLHHQLRGNFRPDFFAILTANLRSLQQQIRLLFDHALGHRVHLIAQQMIDFCLRESVHVDLFEFREQIAVSCGFDPVKEGIKEARRHLCGNRGILLRFDLLLNGFDERSSLISELQELVDFFRFGPAEGNGFGNRTAG